MFVWEIWHWGYRNCSGFENGLWGSDQSYNHVRVSFMTGREENELNTPYNTRSHYPKRDHRISLFLRIEMEEGAKTVDRQVGNEKGKRVVMGRMESLDWSGRVVPSRYSMSAYCGGVLIQPNG